MRATFRPSDCSLLFVCLTQPFVSMSMYAVILFFMSLLDKARSCMAAPQSFPPFPSLVHRAQPQTLAFYNSSSNVASRGVIVIRALLQ